MKIVILAAGEGKRMRPLTETTPKPLLRFRGKTILDHLFLALPNEIDEAILVINYLGDQIKDYCGDKFHSRRIFYAAGQTKGTGFDVMSARTFIDKGERFSIAYGDEVFSRENLRACLKYEYSWLCFTTTLEQAHQFGMALIDENSRIKSVVEKPQNPPSTLAVNGFMVTDSDIFNYQVQPHANGEQYLSDMMGAFAQDYPVQAVICNAQPSITTPDDLIKNDFNT